MLKTSGSTESTTRPGKGGVGVGGDGGDDGGHEIAAPLTSRLWTSASTDASTSAARVMVKYDEVDGGRSGAVGKSVKKSSKSRRIVKKSKKPQRSEKFAKAIGLEERLPKHQSSVN